MSAEEFDIQIEAMETGFSLEEKQILYELVSMTGSAKEVLILYYQGYQIKEIAEILSISESAVKMRLKRGREKLKVEMGEAEFAR